VSLSEAARDRSDAAVEAYITPKGIDAKDVTVPPGTHMIRIEVTDSDGRSTSRIMKIQVASK
jgi:hypothetical protein